VTSAERTSIASIPLILAIAIGIAWAGSQAGVRAIGIPLFALCGILSFAINWLVFVPAYVSQSERFFDLTGSITYVSLVATALLLSGAPDSRALLLGTMVTVWALRLGSFLFVRVHHDGGDGRFDEIKPSFVRFLMAWTLQGLWVLLTLSCALAAMTTADPQPLGVFALFGSFLWAAGFALEILADSEKRCFRAVPDNRSRFIQSGIWAWSRHPNYFGEITLWLGISLIALPVLSGWQYATLISPVFVYVLLTRISGIPLLESRAKKKWGDDPEYRSYRERTPVLFPRPPRPS
jgi:steroid 5-alpha reductase family enzyme